MKGLASHLYIERVSNQLANLQWQAHLTLELTLFSDGAVLSVAWPVRKGPTGNSGACQVSLVARKLPLPTVGSTWQPGQGCIFWLRVSGQTDVALRVSLECSFSL